MKGKIGLLITLLFCGLLLQAQDEQQLRDALLNHEVVVRGYYTGPDLKFDQNGQLTSPSGRGFGQLDARIFVTDVQLHTNTLVIGGQHTFSVYDSKSKEYRVALTGNKVNVEIALPSDKPAMEAALNSLKLVFFTTPELQNQCTSEEQARFQDLLPKPKQKSKKERDEKPNDAHVAHDLADLPRICLPTGEEAYRVGRGIQKPKVTETSDPEYTDKARKKRTQGTVVLLTIIDERGRPTTLYVTQSLDFGLDQAAVQAVQKWSFDPAAFQGSPVPVVINVEINFRLY